MTADLLGNAQTQTEHRLIAAYEALKSLTSEDLAPCVAINVQVALCALGIAATDLGLCYEHLVDFGC